MAERYILDRPIAEGGMGSVWRARHRTLGRHFAIKFLKSSVLGGESMEQRFLGEARMAASIQHRFVVDIVDFGVTSDAVPYMVMEFLEGESLDRRCRRLPPLAVPELLRIAAEALLGLEAVHQAGIVHRDLKPENIMLVREADGVIPKLVDFGISSAEFEPAGGRGRLTSPGTVMGTPWYMSPEQARRENPDRRTDIYSIGVIVYEALVGEAPFDHPELSQLLEQVKAGGASPLVARRPELGHELSALIEQAMSIDPATRFETAAQMAAHLEQLALRLPRSLMCAPAMTVTRTDTEVVSRPPVSVPRTRELGTAGGMTQPVHRWRSPRGIALTAAVAGLAILAWVVSRPGALAESVAASTALEEPATPGSRPTIVSGEAVTARSPAAKGDRTFAATVGPAAVAEPEKRGARRGRSEGRRPIRTALPDVFRTPGF